jgi:hypothetical protein
MSNEGRNAMDLFQLAKRLMAQTAIVTCALFASPPASAALVLDYSLIEEQLEIFLRADAPIESVTGVDIAWAFDPSALQLVGKPAFQGVLASADFKLPSCVQTCGGFFEEEQAPFPSSTLLKWSFNVLPIPSTKPLPVTTTFSVDVLIDEVPIGNPPPLVITLAVPEPQTIALLIAGLGLLLLSARRPRSA